MDFTQPSPPVGVAVPHAPDNPWDANMILEEQQGQKNKDKRKTKEAELEKEQRKQRSDFPLRTVPVALEATVAANVMTDETGKFGCSRFPEFWFVLFLFLKNSVCVFCGCCVCTFLCVIAKEYPMLLRSDTQTKLYPESLITYFCRGVFSLSKIPKQSKKPKSYIHS